MGNDKASFKPKAALIYNRQSEKEDEGMERQDKLNRALAEREGIPVARSFFDNDVSASKPRGGKTAWDQLLQAVKTGEGNVVIATQMDRLLRTQKDLLTLIELGAIVRTVDGVVDLATPQGEMMAWMVTTFAKLEVERKAERQMRANRYRAEQGRPGGIWVPFGYVNDPKDRSRHMIAVVPEEAAAIRNAAELYLAGGSLAAIARSWNDAGHLTNRNMPFSTVTVKGILKNPRYAGLLRYNGEPMGAGIWEPILDMETWKAIQAKITARSHPTTPMSVAKHLLVGTLLCGYEGCGRRLGTGYKGKGEQNRLYRCPKTHVVRSAVTLEKYLGMEVVERLARPDAYELLHTADILELGQLRDEQQQLVANQTYLSVELGLNRLPLEAHRQAMAALAPRLEWVEQQLAQAGRNDVLAPLVASDDVQRDWDALPRERKRVVYERLLTATVHPLPHGSRAGFSPDHLTVNWVS